MFTLTSNFVLPNSSSVSLFEYTGPTLKGKEYFEGYGYINYGKGINNVHYINLASSGSNNDFNTNQVDLDYVIHAIGDVEIQSSSILVVTGSELQTGSFERSRAAYSYIDFTDIKHFRNRKILSSSVKYKSYVNGGDGIQDGTPMGRTAYFSASSDGTITYPINHDINYHNVRDQLHNLYVTKNKKVDIIDPITKEIVPNQEVGLGQFKNGLDVIPSASVYTIPVTGTDVTRVKVERLNKKNKK